MTATQFACGCTDWGLTVDLIIPAPFDAEMAYQTSVAVAFLCTCMLAVASWKKIGRSAGYKTLIKSELKTLNIPDQFRHVTKGFLLLHLVRAESCLPQYDDYTRNNIVCW